MRRRNDVAAIADDRPRVCAAVVAESIAVIPEFLPAPVVLALAAIARRRDRAGESCAARVGRGAGRIERSDIRGDRTLWLDAEAPRSSRTSAVAGAGAPADRTQRGDFSRALFLRGPFTHCFLPGRFIAAIATAFTTMMRAFFLVSFISMRRGRRLTVVRCDSTCCERNARRPSARRHARMLPRRSART